MWIFLGKNSQFSQVLRWFWDLYVIAFIKNMLSNRIKSFCAVVLYHLLYNKSLHTSLVLFFRSKMWRTSQLVTLAVVTFSWSNAATRYLRFGWLWHYSVKFLLIAIIPNKFPFNNKLLLTSTHLETSPLHFTSDLAQYSWHFAIISNLLALFLLAPNYANNRPIIELLLLGCKSVEKCFMHEWLWYPGSTLLEQKNEKSEKIYPMDSFLGW